MGISREAAMEKMVNLQCVYADGKRKREMGVIRECIGIITRLSEEPPPRPAVEEAEVVVRCEPFFPPKGAIGRDVYRCGRCRMRVDQKDLYCRWCGRKLVAPDRTGDGNA